ncbi:MAG: hypothetical protein WC966_09610 [Bradymonadales bacterium]
MCWNVREKKACRMLIFTLLAAVGVLACSTENFLNYTKGSDGLCPPRDSRCCPEEMESCRFDEMMKAGRCEVLDDQNYARRVGKCLEGDV